MTEQLTCTKMIRIDDGLDAQGRPQFYHEPCGAPAIEVEIGGALAKAKAVLCGRHRQMADRSCCLSKNGFPKGKVSKKAKKEGYYQEQMPGTGVL